jgi:hypothetical protein
LQRLAGYALGSVAVLAGLRAAPTRAATTDASPGTPAALPSAVVAELQKSPLVYVSPLLADGRESTCHGEVWFAWQDGAVWTTTAAGRWKARSIARGLDRARIWVGDYGRWKALIGRNEQFREGASFLASAEAVSDQAAFDGLMKIYERKYPKEIANWRDKMRAGYADGTRILVRYAPLSRS